MLHSAKPSQASKWPAALFCIQTIGCMRPPAGGRRNRREGWGEEIKTWEEERFAPSTKGRRVWDVNSGGWRNDSHWGRHERARMRASARERDLLTAGSWQMRERYKEVSERSPPNGAISVHKTWHRLSKKHLTQRERQAGTGRVCMCVIVIWL